MTVADPRSTARLGLMESYRTLVRSDWIDATGRSMDPSIPAGSRLLVDFGRPAQRRGEVLVFRRGERVLAHRLVGRRTTPDGEQLIAKGDGEVFFDAPLTAGEVLGVVRLATLPDGRTEDLHARPRRDAAIATASWWSGRAAGFWSRRLRRVPATARLRRAALTSLVDLSRVPTRVLVETLPRSIRGQAGGRR
ncbi:MAG TPA: S24/S26 family peptidase [Candidatus Limnocylindrales bacterium]|jgi:hypothetical protein